VDEATARRFELSVRRIADVAAEVAELFAVATEVLGMEAHDTAAAASGDGVYTEEAYFDQAEGMRQIAGRLKKIARRL
jgi:hypothetical protein